MTNECCDLMVTLMVNNNIWNLMTTLSLKKRLLHFALLSISVYTYVMAKETNHMILW